MSTAVATLFDASLRISPRRAGLLHRARMKLRGPLEERWFGLAAI